MASLDFSSDKPNGHDDVGSHDLQALVDQASFGTRTRDGLYEVKDWEFSRGGDATDDVIAQALKPNDAKAAAPSGSLGALGSIFARLTGSKVLSAEDLQPVLEAMKQHLMKKNVAKEIAEKVCEGVGEGLVGKKVGGFQSDHCFPSFFYTTLLKPGYESHFYSNECRRAHGTFYLSHAYPHAENLHRSPTLDQNQVVLAIAVDATAAAI